MAIKPSDEDKTAAIALAKANTGLGADPPKSEIPKAAKAEMIERQPIHKPVHKPQRELSDEEIMRLYETEEADQFYIDPEIEPAGLKYEWKRLEVYGKQDKPYEAEMERKGWVPVMAETHDGYFLPKGQKGHVQRGGQGLYAMTIREYRQRQRFNQIMANRAVQDNEAALGMSAKGQFQRTTPRIQKDYEAVDVEEH